MLNITRNTAIDKLRSKGYNNSQKNLSADNSFFKVNNNDGAEAFGITLEPAGGSKSPTLKKLYILGKV
jgi:hypothetical protein